MLASMNLATTLSAISSFIAAIASTHRSSKSPDRSSPFRYSLRAMRRHASAER